ncbi:MAG: ComEC/Rec2 family competence protein [Clostridium perfringens]|nr:ComEC/Rec2 family competence protein [Clostridium perfringens]
MKRKTIKFLCVIATAFLVRSFFIGCAKSGEKNNNTNSSYENSQDNDDLSNNVHIVDEESEVHFIDTGNSDAILIKCEDKAILIDGGDNNDEKLVVSYLKNQGVERIDYMIATHPHSDHIGGLDAVIKELDVKNLLVANGQANTKTYRDFIEAAANKGLNPSVPLEGAVFYLESNSYIKIFNTNGGINTNEESLVTLFVNGEDKFLFTGDAEEGTEKEILNDMIDVDVLKISHHGSKTSTSGEFLERVNPEYAVITVGENNKYKHPHEVTMEKLKENGIEVYRTDECGDIIFKSSGNNVSTDSVLGSYSYRG